MGHKIKKFQVKFYFSSATVCSIPQKCIYPYLGRAEVNIYQPTCFKPVSDRLYFTRCSVVLPGSTGDRARYATTNAVHRAIRNNWDYSVLSPSIAIFYSNFMTCYITLACPRKNISVKLEHLIVPVFLFENILMAIPFKIMGRGSPEKIGWEGQGLEIGKA